MTLTQVLTNEMHDAVRDSPVGQFIDRLIREEVARGGDTHFDGGGNVIQALWEAFGGVLPKGPTSFRDIKQGIKDASV